MIVQWRSRGVHTKKSIEANRRVTKRESRSMRRRGGDGEGTVSQRVKRGIDAVTGEGEWLSIGRVKREKELGKSER